MPLQSSKGQQGGPRELQDSQPHLSLLEDDTNLENHFQTHEGNSPRAVSMDSTSGSYT